MTLSQAMGRTLSSGKADLDGNQQVDQVSLTSSTHKSVIHPSSSMMMSGCRATCSILIYP